MGVMSDLCMYDVSICFLLRTTQVASFDDCIILWSEGKKIKVTHYLLSFGNYESENDKMPQTSNSRVGVHEIYCVGYCLYVQFRSVKYWIRSTQLIISYNFATYFEYIWVISHPGGIRDLIYVGVNSFIF